MGLTSIFEHKHIILSVSAINMVAVTVNHDRPSTHQPASCCLLPVTFHLMDSQDAPEKSMLGAFGGQFQVLLKKGGL